MWSLKCQFDEVFSPEHEVVKVPLEHSQLWLYAESVNAKHSVNITNSYKKYYNTEATSDVGTEPTVTVQLHTDATLKIGVTQTQIF